MSAGKTRASVSKKIVEAVAAGFETLEEVQQKTRFDRASLYAMVFYLVKKNVLGVTVLDTQYELTKSSVSLLRIRPAGRAVLLALSRNVPMTLADLRRQTGLPSKAVCNLIYNYVERGKVRKIVGSRRYFVEAAL